MASTLGLCRTREAASHLRELPKPQDEANLILNIVTALGDVEKGMHILRSDPARGMVGTHAGCPSDIPLVGSFERSLGSTA
jgi:hypothetical protein